MAAARYTTDSGWIERVQKRREAAELEELKRTRPRACLERVEDRGSHGDITDGPSDMTMIAILVGVIVVLCTLAELVFYGHLKWMLWLTGGTLVFSGLAALTHWLTRPAAIGEN